MKKLVLSLSIFATALLAGCGSSQEINGHTLRTADKSVKILKERLPPENRMEFEISYWTIRDAKKDTKEFLDAVDGKTPLEIIALGKEVFQERKNNGFELYKQYSSWEQMITKYMQDRQEQDNRRNVKKRDLVDNPNNSVLYDLHR
jgi:hypothetical protein